MSASGVFSYKGKEHRIYFGADVSVSYPFAVGFRGREAINRRSFCIVFLHNRFKPFQPVKG